MRKFLSKLMATITRESRYFPEVTWSTKSLTHNVFRLYETIFGRRFGIKAELTSVVEEGKVYYACHSWESVFALSEQYVREILSSWKWVPIKLYIPMFRTPQGIPVFASPYIFAVAWDANSNGSANTTSLNVTHVCTGTNLVLITWLELSGGNTFTGATYNSASFTNISGPTAGVGGLSGNFYSFQYLLNPSTGSNTANFTSSVSHFITPRNTSYSGVKQSGFPDSTALGSGTSATGFSLTTTVVASNCWLVGGIVNSSNNFVAGASTFIRNATSIGICDSNATVSTGSQSLAVTWSGAGDYNWSVLSMAPASTSGANVQVEIWGAGGGGSNYDRAGGGAGAYVINSSVNVTSGVGITIYVGQGGRGASDTVTGVGGTGFFAGGDGGLGTFAGGARRGAGGGGSSCFIAAGGNIIASGGGGGANLGGLGATGSSGGVGGAGTTTPNGSGGGGGSGTVGGNGGATNAGGAGGTGGTTQTGTNGDGDGGGGSSAGASGNGNSAAGFTGGAGSGGASGGTGGSGGAGAAGTGSDSGGGGGCNTGSGSGGVGGQPSGGGGGGSGAAGQSGANGGDGKCIITAPIGTITSATGGTHTTSGGNDIWTFTTNGTTTWTPTISSGTNSGFFFAAAS